MKLKIIQIVDRFLSKDDEATLVALADDGTLWEGMTQCINEEAVKKAHEFNQEVKLMEYKNKIGKMSCSWQDVEGTIKVPLRVYEFQWAQIKGLPDDNNNLGKVR